MGINGFGVVNVCGRKREPRPAIGTIIFIFSFSYFRTLPEFYTLAGLLIYELLYSGTSKSACTAFCCRKLFHFSPFGTFMLCNDHLGNAFAIFYYKCFVRKVCKNHANFSTIICIDGSG